MFKYSIWCRTCKDKYSMGCFGGKTQESEKTYDTAKKAKAAAKRRTSLAANEWQYKIFEVEPPEEG